jgi:hypothetical protein
MADTDADDARCFKLHQISDIELAFDHQNILEDAFKLLNVGK